MDIIKIDDTTWRIEDGHVRFFLLTGTEKALLIDTGMTAPKAREIAESLTDLPIELLNTHTDPDHTAGNGAFEKAYMSPNEEMHYTARARGPVCEIIPVKDGDSVDLGDRKLTIIDNPGHTPGSICILDEKNRVLYGGDSIQDGRIFMFGPGRDLPQYIASMKKLCGMRDAFDQVYPSHGTIPVKPELMDQLLEGAQQILDGKAAGKAAEMFGQPITEVAFPYAVFLCNAG